MILAQLEENPGLIIKQGLDLYNKNIRNDDCLNAMVSAMRKAGYNEDKMAKYIEEISKLRIKKDAVPV